MHILHLLGLIYYKHKDDKIAVVTDEVFHMPSYMKIYGRYKERSIDISPYICEVGYFFYIHTFFRSIFFLIQRTESQDECKQATDLPLSYTSSSFAFLSLI